ncbi:MAG TPA: outer membrane protein transport protein [Parvularculaceae bacterium]|nr:outer membrane protein transport protein [Parvularculaceae bacterium]
MPNAARHVFAASFLAAIGSQSNALAGGFALEQHNARALGAAFAGAQARRADPGLAVYNPAAIAGVDGVDFSANASGIWSRSSYENAQGALFGVAPISGTSSARNYAGDALIPTLVVAAPLSERITIGLSVHSPFGLNSDFESDSVIRYQAQLSEAKTIAATPMIAIALTDDVVIAGGLRVQYFDLSVTAIIDAGGIAAANMVPGFAPGSSDLPAAFDGDDVEIGFTAGFQASLTPQLTIGGSFASKADHDIEGDASFDLAVSPAAQALNALAGAFAPSSFASAFNTPAMAGFGVEYAASDRWTLLASTTWSGWSNFEDVTLIFDNPAQPPEILNQNWKDGWTLSLGSEFAAREATTLRAGFMYDATPVNAAFASPRIPDADRYWATVGVTQILGERLSADLGVAVAFFEDREIGISGLSPADQLRGSLDATIKATAYAVSGRLRYSF